MEALDVLGGAVRVAGVVELEPTPFGIALHRLPAWARQQHNDVTLAFVETMPSGGRIEMVTDATCVELDVALTAVQLGEVRTPGVLEIAVDGEVTDAHVVDDLTTLVLLPDGSFDVVPGGPATVRFERLGPGEKRVEIRLPHAAATQLIELRADGVVSPGASQRRRRWIHYGSSISHCLEALRPTGTWPAIAARLADVDLQSFAFAGQCQLDPFVARVIAEQPADLVSAKLGINVVNADSMRERVFVPAVHGFLDTVRAAHPEVPLVVITPIICPVVEDHPGPTNTIDGRCSVVERPDDLAVGALTLQRVRELEREVVAARQATDPNLHLVEGTELFGKGDVADLPDGLHPNAAGYERMGRRFHDLAFAPGAPFGPGSDDL